MQIIKSCAKPSAANRHPTVDVYYPFWRLNIQVDKEIVPLLGAIWKLGIPTENSCQDDRHSGEIWICFSSPTYLAKFIDLLIKYGTLGLARKITDGKTWLYDGAIDKRDNMHLASVWLPVSDLELVMDALSEALVDTKR